jgi:hypothetical protein
VPYPILLEVAPLAAIKKRRGVVDGCHHQPRLLGVAPLFVQITGLGCDEPVGGSFFRAQVDPILILVITIARLLDGPDPEPTGPDV